MADSDGRDETGSSSGKTRVKDSQLEDHNQQPAAINTPTASSEEEEEARERQEAPPPPPTSMIISEPEAASFHPPAPPVAQASGNDDGAVGRLDLNELPAVEDEDEDEQPAAIHTPTASSEEGEEAREHQEAEPTVQETNRDAATGEEKEEMNEDAEVPLLHGGEMTKERKTDHEDGSGVVTLTVVGGDLLGAQTGTAALPMVMGGSGSEVGGVVSESAAAEWRSLPRPAYKYTYSPVGVHGVRRRYEFKGAAAAAASLDDNAAAAANRGAEEPPPRPAGQDEDEDEEEEER